MILGRTRNSCALVLWCL